MATVMVVGASRGIGLALAREYAAHGWRVHATTRTPDTPGALGALGGDVHLHGLDVSEPAQRSALAAALEGEALDVLIDNAGVYGTGMQRQAVMRVNAHAPLAVAEALLLALERGRGRRLALMTSRMGSRAGGRGDLGLYGESKAALNDGFREQAPRWASRGITAVALHPGWVRTDMGGSAAPLSPERSARDIRVLLEGLSPGDHGRFLDHRGRELPW